MILVSHVFHICVVSFSYDSQFRIRFSLNSHTILISSDDSRFILTRFPFYSTLISCIHDPASPRRSYGSYSVLASPTPNNCPRSLCGFSSYFPLTSFTPNVIYRSCCYCCSTSFSSIPGLHYQQLLCQLYLHPKS